MDKIKLNSSTKFTVLEELNSEFTLVKIKVMATGKNRNMSYFAKKVVEMHLNSLDYAPVVAHLFKDENGEYKIGGHDMYIDTETWTVKSMCVPFGVVKAGSYNWETVNEYGVDVEYLTCEAILWTGRYPELKETIYSDEVWWNQSMEINVAQYRPLEEDSNYIEILDFEFSALCLLYKSDNREENVEPCFISADVTPINFNSDDFMSKMNEMKQAMSEVFAFENKEGEHMEENKEISTELENKETVENNASNEVEEVTATDYEALYNQAIASITQLTETISGFETQVNELNAQIETLAAYKAEKEKAERKAVEDEIFAKYEDNIGDAPEFAALKEKAAEYDLEQLDRECIMIVGKYAMQTFSLKKDVKKEVQNSSIMKFAIETSVNKTSPYGDLFERYGNND